MFGLKRLCDTISIMKKKGLFLLLRIFISLFFISLLLRLMRGRFDSIILSLKSTNIPLFSLGLLLFWICVAITSYRLEKILSAQEVYISFKDALRLTLIGYFFNSFLPSAVGGDVAKAYYTSQKTEKKFASVTSIFIDRLMGLLGMVAMATAVLIFWGRYIQNRRITSTVTIILGVLIGLVLFLMMAPRMKNLRPLRRFLRFFRLEGHIKRLIEVIRIYNLHRRLMQNMFYLSIFSQSLGAIVIYLLARSLSLEVPLGLFFVLVPIIGVAGMFPSINGLGLREGAYVCYLGPLVGGENAFTLSILWLVLLLINSLIGGLIYAFGRDFRLVRFKESKC